MDDQEITHIQQLWSDIQEKQSAINAIVDSHTQYSQYLEDGVVSVDTVKKTLLNESQSINMIKDISDIEHPAHYNIGTIEAIDVIMDWGLDFCLGNVVKYVCRSVYHDRNGQGNRKDLEKAAYYLKLLLDGND